MESSAETERQIRAHIADNFLLGEDDGFDNSESLLDAGVVDSTGVMELAVFLEQTFSIKVNDEDFIPENLDTIANMVAFVHRKQARCVDGTAREH